VTARDAGGLTAGEEGPSPLENKAAGREAGVNGPPWRLCNFTVGRARLLGYRSNSDNGTLQPCIAETMPQRIVVAR